MIPLFWRSSLRYLLYHPWQLVLSLLGIALGVAVVVAVDLANASARRSFELSMEQITGHATHRIVGGLQGIPEQIYTRLRIELGLHKTAPVVTGYAAPADEPGRLLQVLGVDIFAESLFRSHSEALFDNEIDITALLTEFGTVVIPRSLSGSIKSNNELEVLVGEDRVTLRKVGLLNDSDLDGLILTDISTAQELFDQQGWLSHIDLILTEGDAGKQQVDEINKILPPGLRLERTLERQQATSRLSSAFQLNLSALSLLALVVGIFLIYNTMTFAVIQRRVLLGMLRTLGVSRREVFGVVLGEALLLGLIGTLLGGALGVWLGSGLVHLVTRTINDLYYVTTVREFYIAPWSLIKGALLGLLATMAAAWLPAREAAHAPPGSALSRAHLESRWQTALPLLNLSGLIMLVLGGAILMLTHGLISGFLGLFVIILACAFLTPGCLMVLARLTRSITIRGRGLLPRMAIRDVVRNLSRTGVAVAALMIAFSATVGVGIMVDSFRSGVILWLDDLLNADLYVAPVRSPGNDAQTLGPEVVAILHTTPGVAALSTYRSQQIRLDHRLVDLVAVDLAPRARTGYRLIDGDPRSAWQAFEKDAVLISEPLAYHQNLETGNSLPLHTDQGVQTFPIAGIFHDYGSEHGRILIHRPTYDRFWNDPGIDSAAVYGGPGRDLQTLRHHLEASLGEIQRLTIRSNRDIRERALTVFDRTFTITEVLRFLAIAVAFVGVLSALMALQLERAREFALLRAIGMTPGEIGRLVFSQTGFMGFIAGLLAIPVGVMLAAVLIFVIQRRAFGWTLPLEIDPWILVQAIFLSVLAALLAGIYPLWRMSHTNPALALRSE